MVYVILEKDEPYDGEIQATPVCKGDYEYYKAKGYTTEKALEIAACDYAERRNAI